MRVPILLTSILLATVLLPAVAPAQGRKDRKAAKAANQAANPEGPVDLDLGQAKLGAVVAAAAAGDAGKQSDWPAVAVGSDGSIWMIYVEWNDKDADRLLVR